MLRHPASTPLVVRSLDELQLAMRSVPYKRGCVACDNSVKLECPKCPSGQVCQFTVPVDCTQCPHSTCMPDDSSTAAAPSNNGSGTKDGPSAGPIAGGVIGGVALLAVVTFLVWKFFVKPKRSQSIYEAGASTGGREMEKDNGSRLTRRSSTHTVHSIASTVLTRASNIIQIAYIPGVTNRATPTSPTVLVPPVPPIPMQHSAGAGGRESGRDDQHFFVPGNLRNSTYSGISAFTDRTSFAPRSSIASTIYGRQAQIQTPAQTVMRAKPTVVSVRAGGGGGGSPNATANTPPVPVLPTHPDRLAHARPKSGGSALSNVSTVVNNANTATQARAQVVKLGDGLKTIKVGSKSEGSAASAASPTLSTGRASASDSCTTKTLVDEPVDADQGPFSDPPAVVVTVAPVNAPTLSSVAEDEGEGRHEKRKSTTTTTTTTTRTSQAPADRDQGPFGDEHASKE